MPCELFFSFLSVAGPRLLSQSALGEVMIWSQMTASLVEFVAPTCTSDGHSAVT